ncbi:prolipoprotein diacylglyceryl transferase [Microbacterium gorillae]|uniref:prolipoprotein diacylglyceryl transferase n=1 Tax=Microbacterium gorillae TaxID=1231063 RepID=UPI00058DD28B|nr:prolipoprotein diacylglyceryl transferase [Microbacterium gorillae]
MLLSASTVLASIPSPPINSWDFSIFGVGISIKFYALFIILGIIIAVIMSNRTLTKRGAEPWVIVDICLIAVPLAIICARIFHVLTHYSFYFGPEQTDPWAWAKIWEGGIAIYGALIGGAIGAWLGCKWTGIRFWTFADAIAPWMLLAQALGRLGNYFNHELFGLPTDLPWGLEIEKDNPAFPAGLAEGTLFQPTFLYEIIWNVIGVVLLLWLGRKLSMQWGRLFAVYLIWYSAGRIVWESIRIDPSDIILGLRTNVWSAIFGVVIGIVILIVQRRHLGQEPSPYQDGRGRKDVVSSQDTPEDFVDLSEPTATLDDESTSAATSTAGAGSVPTAG